MSKKVVIIASQEGTTESASGWWNVFAWLLFPALFGIGYVVRITYNAIEPKVVHVYKQAKSTYDYNHSDIKERMAKYGLYIEELQAMRKDTDKRKNWFFTSGKPIHRFSIDAVCKGQPRHLFHYLIEGKDFDSYGQWETWNADTQYANKHYRVAAYVMCEGSDKLYYNIQNHRYNSKFENITPIEVQHGKYE